MAEREKLKDSERRLLELLLATRVAEVEVRIEDLQKKLHTGKRLGSQKTIEYYVGQKHEAADLLSKLQLSRALGLIYEGEAPSEHVT